METIFNPSVAVDLGIIAGVLGIWWRIVVLARDRRNDAAAEQRAAREEAERWTNLERDIQENRQQIEYLRTAHERHKQGDSDILERINTLDLHVREELARLSAKIELWGAQHGRAGADSHVRRDSG